MSQLAQLVDAMAGNGRHFPTGLAEITGIPKANVYALLSQLKKEGGLVGDGKVGYSLSTGAGTVLSSPITMPPAPTVGKLPAVTATPHELSAVISALLTDEPDWTPMPRALLEEVSGIRGAALTAALQTLTASHAIKETEGGYEIDDVVVARGGSVQQGRKNGNGNGHADVAPKLAPVPHLQNTAPAATVLKDQKAELTNKLGLIMLSDAGGLTLSDSKGEILLVLLPEEVRRLQAFLHKCGGLFQ